MTNTTQKGSDMARATGASLLKAQDDNNELTRVGRGTVMGALMRHYWIPAAKSEELVAGGDPMRLVLLGERLVAFRAPEGDVGVMDHRCPHRNASLFFGRNEVGGIRCIYHGWKFAPSGRCVETPNVPARYAWAEKVRSRGYATHESKGLIWVFMGDQSQVPGPPRLEALEADEADLEIEFLQRRCNYLQALEGDIDTSHLGFLHMGSVQPEQLNEQDLMRYVVGNRAPELEVADAPWGTTYCAAKDVADGESYLRFANFMFPFWTQAPQGEFETNIFARAWVPMDDEHTMSVTMRWKRRPAAFKKMRNGKDLPGVAPIRYELRTTNWYGRWLPIQQLSNDYEIDREAQRQGSSFSGIMNIAMQDHAVTESMEPITDRSIESLAPSDLMITRTRQRLLRAARELRDKGTTPPGVDDPSVYQNARSGETVVQRDRKWPEQYARKLKEATRVIPASSSSD